MCNTLPFSVIPPRGPFGRINDVASPSPDSLPDSLKAEIISPLMNCLDYFVCLTFVNISIYHVIIIFEIQTHNERLSLNMYSKYRQYVQNLLSAVSG